jgi:hypothetical protein
VTLIWFLWQGRARFLSLGVSPRHVESPPRVGRGTGWLGWPVYGGGCSGGRWQPGTPCAEQTPAISCSDEVESARGHTDEALASFIGAGKGHGRGFAQRGARGVGRWACSDAFRARRTHGGVLLPMFNSLPRSQTCESWQKSGAGLFLAPMAISCM